MDQSLGRRVGSGVLENDFRHLSLCRGLVIQRRVKFLEREAKSGIGTLVDWDMGLFGISTRNTMRYKYEMPKAGRAVMDWHVTEGGVRKLVGRYEFVAVGPSQTKVVYNLLVEPGFPLPDMIKRATQRTIARSALQELKRYTERQRQSSEATEATALLAAAAPQRVSRCGHTAAPPGDERPLASLHVGHQGVAPPASQALTHHAAVV